MRHVVTHTLKSLAVTPVDSRADVHVHGAASTAMHLLSTP